MYYAEPINANQCDRGLPGAVSCDLEEYARNDVWNRDNFYKTLPPWAAEEIGFPFQSAVTQFCCFPDRLWKTSPQ